MSNRTKFLPLLGLALALAPFAANARSDRAPLQDPAHLEFVVGGPATGPGYGVYARQGANRQVVSVAQGRASLGRSSQSSPPGGEFLMEISPQYAEVATQPQETGEN